MGSWNVHRVRREDAARMRALRLEMLADSPLAFLETLAQAAQRSHESYRQRVVQAASGGSLAMFVADPGDGGPLIGHAGGTVAPDFPGETVIFAVYVTPAYRGGKVVADLIEAVSGWSRAAGRRHTLLEVVVGNDRAVRAYEKLGFCDTGERVPHPVIPTLTELRMRRSV
ncbi:GNAT family N-acetyltransferase [Actinoplanes sp. LDG1-06]|uniref:GNAT family N-acetyltransferase n=1 Tax=Paractinoplanes ovalisporus TaxID=2810368 RepID=A0ABS2ADG4_9ACTN|nr:GNAT family N-acetyltransferase [Actinoplanes ovalisporus]MBM2617299.1 GNAT family N-acetyltransferase [Actinoplanes ovalisporus]